MSKRRGAVEEQTVRMAALMKASEQMTKAGLFSVTIVSHPTEGIIISGEEEMGKVIQGLMQNSDLATVVSEAPTKAGSMINHFSTRTEKEKALRELYDCNLPPLPLPFSEFKTFTVMAAQFGKLLEAEMQGTKYKVGDQVPGRVKEWFEEDQEVFDCLRGVTHTSKLGPALKSRGTTTAEFYRKMLRAAYTLRLKGEAHLETYHLERDMEDLQRLVRQKRESEGAQAATAMGEEGGEKVAEEKAEEVKIQDNELQNEEVRKLLTPGELLRMHKDAKCSEAPVVQLLAKNVVEGKLLSMTISDGVKVSENVVPANDELGQRMNKIKQYDLIQIEKAAVFKSKIVLHAMDHLQMTDTDGQYVGIKEPVRAKEVVALKKFRQETLDMWGIRFNMSTNVEMVDKEDLNNTMLREDPLIMKVGQKQSREDDDTMQSKRIKRSLVSCPFCIRTFTDQNSLKKHMSDDHFD